MKVFFQIFIIVSSCLFSSISVAQDDSTLFSPIRREILVRGDFDFPPYEFINENGEFDGFNVELFHVLADELGLNMNLSLEPWHKIKEEVARGEIDVVMGVAVDISRSPFMNFGTPHGIMTHGLFTHKNVEIYNLEDLKKLSVAVQNGDIMYDLLIKNEYADSIIIAESLKQVLRLVEEGKADAALMGNYQGAFLIKNDKLKNVVLRTSDIEPYRYSIGVRKGDAELLWLLNSGLFQLKVNGTYDKLYDKWFSVYERKNYFKELFPFIILSVAILLLLVLSLFLLYRQVNQFKRKQKKVENYLSAASSMAPIGIGILSNHIIVMGNDFLSRITGYKMEELVGVPFRHFFLTDDGYIDVYNTLIRKLKIADSASMEAHWKRKDGSSYYVHLSVTPFEKDNSEDSMLLTVTDVTFQRNALMQLHVADERLQLHLDNSPLGYLEMDDKFTIQAWSSQAEKIFGWKKSEVIGRNIYDFEFVYQQDVLQVENHLKRLVNNEEQRNVNRHRNNTKYGVLVDCVWYNSAVHNEDGQLNSIFCLVNDVSDLKRAQNQLIEEQERSQWVIEAAQVGTWEWNLETKEIRSDYYISLLGYSKSEVPSLTIDKWIEMLHPQDRERALLIIEDYLKKEEGLFEIEARIQHKDGHYLTIVEKGSILIKQGVNNKKILTGIVIDVSRIKRAEDFIHKLSVATDQSPASVIITDMDGNIEYVNQKFISTSEYPFEELKGNKLRIFRPGHLSDEDYNTMLKTIKAGGVWNGEHKNRTKSRKAYWESVLISPISDELGDIINFFIVAEDITERKAIQQQLVNAKERAEMSDRLKTTFLNNLSHEVRTPLNAITGFSEILYENLFSHDKNRFYADAIFKSSRQLLAMMDNIINISIIETGKLTIINSETDINQLLNEVYNQMTLSHTKPDVELRINSSIPRKTEKVLLDQMKLHQILINIVGNGLKFTSKGIVEVRCEMDNRFVHFSVKDDGVGIPETIKESIFDRFLQGDNALSGVNTGLGVGLAVVKSYLDLLGGYISFESERGHGTTFNFSVPYTWASSNYDDADSRENFKWPADKKILVVDDVENNYQVISGLLINSEATVLYANTGYEAISKVQEDEAISLVIMDVKMPEIDGWETTREIKKIRPGLPVIIHTAYSLSGEQEKMKELGCEDYLLKPINRTALELLIKKYS